MIEIEFIIAIFHEFVHLKANLKQDNLNLRLFKTWIWCMRNLLDDEIFKWSNLDYHINVLIIHQTIHLHENITMY